MTVWRRSGLARRSGDRKLTSAPLGMAHQEWDTGAASICAACISKEAFLRAMALRSRNHESSSSFSGVLLCYNQGLSSPSARMVSRRGVAQPGRAPGSGPGGRRFKSSLPDHYFQSLTINSWCPALSGVGKVEAAKASKINK